tara:strand:+ start:143 stop:796 length:654 start_codon:yes stop_codon:yes gene_type:complete
MKKSDLNFETLATGLIGIMGIVALMGILSFFYQLWKHKQLKQTDESGFFNGFFSGDANTVSYNLNNPTGNTQTASLFGRLPSSSAAGGVIVTGGAARLAADIQSHPVQVKSIKIISKNEQQVQSPIQISCSSTTGKRVSYFKRPAISPTSFRKDVVEIKPSRLVLSGACKINYDVQPHTQANVTLTLGKSLPGEFDTSPKGRKNRGIEALREMKIIE